MRTKTTFTYESETEAKKALARVIERDTKDALRAISKLASRLNSAARLAKDSIPSPLGRVLRPRLGSHQAN